MVSGFLLLLEGQHWTVFSKRYEEKDAPQTLSVLSRCILGPEMEKGIIA